MEGISANGSVAETTQWDEWAAEALSFLESKHLLRTLLPIQFEQKDDEIEVFHGLGKWDRAAVEVNVSDSEFQALSCCGNIDNSSGTYVWSIYS